MECLCGSFKSPKSDLMRGLNKTQEHLIYLSSLSFLLLTDSLHENLLIARWHAAQTKLMDYRTVYIK